MSGLQPLLARDQYTDAEWDLASAGRCFWQTGTGWEAGLCGGPSDPASKFRWCTPHDRDAREDYPHQYGI